MAMLQFAYVEYSIATRSFDIFNIGCGNGSVVDTACVGCCNPTIRDWNLKGFSAERVLMEMLSLEYRFGILTDKILLVGGDPMDAYLRYKDEMTDFLKRLKQITPKPLFLFTRHELNEIPRELLELVDYVKTGAYIPELTCDDNIQFGIKLATSNQKIFKVSEVLCPQQ